MRDRAWINTDQMEREDVAQLMMDEMVDIKLLRYSELSDDDGFRKQSAERRLEFTKTIKGRIDRKDVIYRPQESDSAKVTSHIFIATVYYKDLRQGDQLQYAGIIYRVKAVNKVGQGFTEADLEIRK